MKKSFLNLLSTTQESIKKMSQNLKKLKEQAGDDKIKFDENPAPAPDAVLVHLSASSVAKASLTVMALILLAYFLVTIRDVLLIFFVSIFFSIALDPLVDKLKSWGLPRSLSVILLFVVIAVLGVFFILQMIPLFATQLVELTRNLVAFVNLNLQEGSAFMHFIQMRLPFIYSMDSSLWLEPLKKTLETLALQAQSLAGNMLNTILALFSSILNIVLVSVITLFLIIDEDGVNKFFLSLFPSKQAPYIRSKVNAIKEKVGAWLIGMIMMMVLMFIISWIGFSLLGLDYALSLAMLVALAELLPVVGAIVAAIPAILVAINISPLLALWTLLFMFFLQQIEGNLLVPLVMKKALGLSPVIILMAVLVGYQILGVLGVILSVPVATALSIFVMDYSLKKK